jgi:hypothetical protein
MHAVLCDRGAPAYAPINLSQTIHTFDEIFPG